MSFKTFEIELGIKLSDGRDVVAMYTYEVERDGHDILGGDDGELELYDPETGKDIDITTLSLDDMNRIQIACVSNTETNAYRYFNEGTDIDPIDR